MSLATDIGAILSAAGLVTLSPAAGFNFFERIIPDTPDEVTAFFEYEGRSADRTQEAGKKILFPRFQLRTRGAKAGATRDDVAEARMKSIHDALDGKANFTLASGRRVLLIEALGYYGFIGRDPLGRGEFVSNYEMQVAS